MHIIGVSYRAHTYRRRKKRETPIVMKRQYLRANRIFDAWKRIRPTQSFSYFPHGRYNLRRIIEFFLVSRATWEPGREKVGRVRVAANGAFDAVPFFFFFFFIKQSNGPFRLIGKIRSSLLLADLPRGVTRGFRFGI